MVFKAEMQEDGESQSLLFEKMLKDHKSAYKTE